MSDELERTRKALDQAIDLGDIATYSTGLYVGNPSEYYEAAEYPELFAYLKEKQAR